MGIRNTPGGHWDTLPDAALRRPAGPFAPRPCPEHTGVHGATIRVDEPLCLAAPKAPNVAIGARYLGVVIGEANDWRLYAVPVDHPAHATRPTLPALDATGAPIIPGPTWDWIEP
jgi:hypothetical protein